jgi:diacylglycerol kinase (ATP)
MLEVVGVTGIVHLGQIQSGIRSGVRLAQGGHVRFLILKMKIYETFYLIRFIFV